MYHFLPRFVFSLALCCTSGLPTAFSHELPANDQARSVEILAANAAVKRLLELAKADHDKRIADQIAVTQIPAPSYKERKRGEYMITRFKELGLENVTMDSVGNVTGLRKGKASAKSNAGKLVIAAHLDTVFPEGTDVTVKHEGGKLVAPGIGDDGAGLGAMLSMLRVLQAAPIQTMGDVLFVANVCEEGLGDLRGVKTLFKDVKDIDGFISIDGANVEHLVYHATGSRRYEITFKGPGGHSFGAFGAPSAIHALGRAIAKIGDVKTASELAPAAPRTTFTVGTIRGGTSVNTIAPSASMMLDMRSNSAQELAALEMTITNLCKQAAQEENARWKSDKIKVDFKLIGDRPAGMQPASLPIVQAAMLSAKALKFKIDDDPASSTDANLPISLGIPAITIGGGGVGTGAHTIEEEFDPTNAYLGVQRALLLMLHLSGVEGVVEPALTKLPARR
jgi:acetylornithine deacetylase/succinyl-diaminopimelate desuccinylase-like protein